MSTFIYCTPWLEVLQLLCLQVLAKFLCVPRTETCSCGSQISQIYFDSESLASLWYKELGSLSFLNTPKSHSSVAVAFLQHFTFVCCWTFLHVRNGAEEPEEFESLQ